MELIDYTLGGILEKWVREQPDHEFMIYPDRGLCFSYKEFDERTDNLARGLLAIGMRPGGPPRRVGAQHPRLADVHVRHGQDRRGHGHGEPRVQEPRA